MNIRYIDYGTGLLFAAVLLLSPGAARAQDSKRESLRGIKAVTVVVEDLSPTAEKAGLDKSRLKSAVESRLTEKGLRLMTEQESGPAAPTLHVQIKTVKHDRNDVEAISITLQLRQLVKLSREPETEIPAVIWQSLRLGCVDRKEISLARHVLITIVDSFISDYAVVNPR